nr:unnamed protein product [Digitaria exilis]
MALSRRFLNLIVYSSEPGVKSLRCMDLKRLQLFYPTTPPSPTTDGHRLESAAVDAGNQKNKQQAPDLEMQSIRLPSPSFTFQACMSHGPGNRWSVSCFPLAERMVLCTDQCGRSFLYDGDKQAVIMPNLHKPDKSTPISLFVPSEDSSGGGSLFLMESSTPGVKLLRRINLARQQLFYPDTPRRSESAWVKEDLPLNMEMIRLSGRSFSFRASDSDLKNERKMDCFPLGDCKVICADNSGGFIFDLSTRRVGTIPPICKPSIMPISVFVPKADVDDDIYHEGNGSSLFLMERFLQLEEAGIQESNQFVGVINRMPATFRSNKSWHCHILAPPPFLREPCYWDNNRPEITAYGVVGGGSQVCISVKGVGTYCLDTASHTWSEVGKWMLPFGGKVEYVPELKLWFGLSAGAQQLAAADLSNMDCEPQLVGPWKELEVPEEWKQCKDSQFVNLGSGRFCIARFFQDMATGAGSGGQINNENFAVLTGVEVNVGGNGKGAGVEVNVGGNGKGRGGKKGKLQMTPHKSRRVNNTSIEVLSSWNTAASGWVLTTGRTNPRAILNLPVPPTMAPSRTSSPRKPYDRQRAPAVDR